MVRFGCSAALVRLEQDQSYDSIRANAAEVCRRTTAQSSAELCVKKCQPAHHSIESDDNGCFPKLKTSISPQNQSSSKQVGLLRGKQVMSYSSYLCLIRKRDVSGTMAELPASDGRFYRPTVTVNAGGPFCRCMRALKCCRSCSDGGEKTQRIMGW